MSFASRSAQALRAASRRAPRNVVNVASKTQRASYSLLARNAVAAPSKAPAVLVRWFNYDSGVARTDDLYADTGAWSQDP